MLRLVLTAIILFSMLTPSSAQVKDARYYYRSGMEHKNNNRLAEALADLNKAVALNKRFDSAWFEIGNLYTMNRNADMAIASFKKTIAVNRGFARAYATAGVVYKDGKLNNDSAMYFFQEAIKLDSGIKEAYYSIAWIHNAKKEYDQAIPYAIKALSIDNNYKAAYGELGHAYRFSKKYAECIEQLKKNLAISPVDIAYLYSGYAYLELNNKEGANQMYEELKKINEKMANTLKKKIDTGQ
jgi:tetratricopeptide (TPR) repeat protein